MDRFRTRLFEPALEQRQGLPALLIWMRVYVDGLRGPELQVRAACVLLGEALGSEPAFLPAINRLHRNVRSMVEHYLREGIERGEVRRDIDPEAQAALLIGTLRGVSLLAVTDPDSLDLDALSAELVVGNGAVTSCLRRSARSTGPASRTPCRDQDRRCSCCTASPPTTSSIGLVPASSTR